MRDFKKEFINVIKTFHQHHKWQVFADFCEMTACSFSNSVDRSDTWQQRENQYFSVIKPYSKDELSRFANLLAIVVEALEQGYQDFLGSVFMELELGNHWKGQYFTPYCVSSVMAEVTYGDQVGEKIKETGFLTLSEPAVGAGGMVIAFAEVMALRGLDPQRQLHVTCVDIDSTAAYMAYIQLTLFHIPAKVIIGNSLSLEVRDCLYTPAHVLGLWSGRLSARSTETGIEDAPETPKSKPAPSQAPPRMDAGIQISLF